jgi:hypothetical protein
MATKQPKAVERVDTSILASFYVRLFMVGFVVLGGAVLIGRSDSGQINVASTIQNSNDAAVEAGGDPADSIATTPSAFKNMPNGGLVPAGGDQQEVAPVEVPPAPKETASTTGNAEGEGTGTEATEPAPAGEDSQVPATE